MDDGKKKKGKQRAEEGDEDYDAEFQRPSEVRHKQTQKRAMADLLAKRKERKDGTYFQKRRIR